MSDPKLTGRRHTVSVFLLLTRQKAEVQIKAPSASSAGQRSGCEQSQNKRKQQHKGRREEEHTGGGLIIDCNTEEEQ